MGLLIRILISAVAVLVAAYVIPNVSVAGFGSALILAIVLGLLNAFVKPVLVALTIPVTIVTLGLFLLVINVLMVYLADSLVGGFDIASSGFGYFITALLFSLLVSLVTYIIDAIIN